MAVGRTDVAIRKPRTDKREYRRVILPNDLEALLISDPETEKAAASMCVSVGSFSDPDGLEGLAHFLEHMLFYASEKYPLEDSYSKYITEHGGSTNAYTSSDHTNFYFDVNADSFEEALDRFAQFFIHPLMSDDATLREIKAVDSENQKNLLSDSWRMNQLQKHLSSSEHPYHKFSTGNWDTLMTVPKGKGLDTRQELIKFYEENYSANLMHLVVYGKGTLDDIQSLVEKLFSDIPNSGRNCVRFQGKPCSSEHVQIFVRAIPVKQGHKLKVLWPITPNIQNYKAGPCVYLGHLIGHEGEGSLYFVLKTLGWAVSLSAGEGESTFDFSFFSVVIELTDAGHEHVEDVIGLLFKYIEMLKKCGITKWIFDELVAICEIGFHYQDKIPPISYVSNISPNMQLYPPEDWLTSLPSEFLPQTIQVVMDELNPENVRIFWESKLLEGCTNSVEPWYGTKYSVEKISCSTIQQWIEAAPQANLHLPAANVFIPTDLSIKHAHHEDVLPKLLRSSSYSRLWYKPDTKFSTPKAYVRIDFNCPHSNYSPEAEVLTDIFARLLMDYLNEYAYDAQVAGLYYGIYHTSTGFEVVVIGYNHKMQTLIDAIIAKIVKFEVKADRFSVIKETEIKEYKNIKYQQPYQQALFYCSLLLEDRLWHWNEELEILPHLVVDDLAKFVPLLLSKSFLECYVAGNIDSTEAELLIQDVESKLFMGPEPICKPIFPSQYLTNRIVKLEKRLHYYYPAEVLNPSDENSALIHYIQVHRDDTRLNIKLQLFALIAKQPAFHQLRTVEQLGYITVLAQRYDSGIRGLQFIIQSSVKDPAKLNDRVDAFLNIFETKLNEMTYEEYKSNVNALIDMKLEKHKNLREESWFYWKEIFDGTLKFDRIQLEVAALRELAQNELLDFFNSYIKNGAPLRKTLVVQVYGGLHLAEYKDAKYDSNQNQQSVRVDDIFRFKRSRPLFGSFKAGAGQMKL